MRRLKRIILLVSIVIFLLHFAITLISGVIISTFLLTISVYVLLTYGLIYLSGICRFNKNLNVSIVALFIVLFSFDTYLRFFDRKYLTYTERSGSPIYNSAYRIHNWWGNDYVEHRKPHSELIISKPEFSYTHNYNNLGFRGKQDIAAVKPGNEYRVLALGDSFTEGVGAPDDSTWCHLLQQKLNTRNGNGHTNIIDAGIAGSDPIYCLTTLKTNHEIWDIDAVLLAINYSDLDDIIFRGGRSRYTDFDKLKLRRGPGWEFFYSFSFIARLFIHNYLNIYGSLIPLAELEQENKFALDELYETVVDFSDYCVNNNMEFCVIIGPHYFELSNGGVSQELKELSERIESQTNIPLIFLPSCFEAHMIATGTAALDYYWKLDQHHNSKGYELFANCVERNLDFGK